MRTIKFLLLLVALVAPFASQAAQARGGATVRAILVTASREKGGTDRRLAPYEAILKNTLRYESYQFVGENSTTVPNGGKASLNVQGAHLELQSEGGTIFVRGGKGGASISPGGPGAVISMGGAENGGMRAIIVVAN